MATSAAKDFEPRAQIALASSPIYELRDLQVRQHGDLLTISGRVSTFYHKQLALEAVRSVCKDVEVANAVDVE